MKILSSLLILLFVVAISCDKDKFTTIPQVTIKSISPDRVVNGNIISVRGEYTDQEGDVDSVLVVYKWYNGATAVVFDTIERKSFEAFQLPPKTKQAEISLDYEYNSFNTGLITISGVNIRDTTATFGIILIDKAGNRSVYAESPKIRLIKP